MKQSYKQSLRDKSLEQLDLKRGVDYIGITVVFFCHDGKGKLLLHKRSSKCRDEIGRWDVGGGAMEFGEEFQTAVEREILEEYCDTPSELKFIGPYNILRENGKVKTHWIALLFFAKLNPKKVKIGDPVKMDEIGWFEPSRLPDSLHSNFHRAFEMVKEEWIW